LTSSPDDVRTQGIGGYANIETPVGVIDRRYVHIPMLPAWFKRILLWLACLICCPIRG
jgi:hypothetical protein